MKFLVIFAMVWSSAGQDVLSTPKGSSRQRPVLPAPKGSSRGGVPVPVPVVVEEVAVPMPVVVEEAVEGGHTCGNVGTGSSRPKAHFCTGDHVLNADLLDTPCPGGVCTDDFCCTVPKAPVVILVEEPEEPSEVSVVIPDPGTCGSVTQGSRPARHVCRGARLVFDSSKLNTKCDGACDDATCCKAAEMAAPFNCNANTLWSREQERYCCITQGIRCKPQSCAYGAGILNDDKSVCCPNSCGKCGGEGCFARGGAQCCKTLIMPTNRPCSHYSAPCSNSAFRKPLFAETPAEATITALGMPTVNNVCAPRRRQWGPGPVVVPRAGIYGSTFPTASMYGAAPPLAGLRLYTGSPFPATLPIFGATRVSPIYTSPVPPIIYSTPPRPAVSPLIYTTPAVSPIYTRPAATVVNTTPRIYSNPIAATPAVVSNALPVWCDPLYSAW